MSDPRLDYKNEYPVELVAPDISCYKNTGSGVDYIVTIDSGFSGPHVFISSVVHGNEPCGAIANDWFLKNNFKPARGKLSLGFMNVEAYKAFDPDNPNKTRWVEEDFNRLWAPGVLEDKSRKKTSEFYRANEVKGIISETDYLLDIHSMQKPCVPLMMAGMCNKGVEFAKKVGMEMFVITDSGHKEGMRMRDYKSFSNNKSIKNALLVECGQHWEKSSEKIAKETLIKFLRSIQIMKNDFGLEYLSNSKKIGNSDVFKVGEIVTIKTENFVFEKDWQGFEKIKKGTIIGNDDGKIIYAPFDETILIMPTKRLFPGKTAVRLAYQIKE